METDSINELPKAVDKIEVIAGVNPNTETLADKADVEASTAAIATNAGLAYFALRMIFIV